MREPRGPFARTVAAIADSVVRERCDPAGTHVAAVTRYVLDQHGRLPDFLRLPVRAATLGFDAFSLAHTGRPFHGASQGQRRRQLGWWRRMPGPGSSLMRFYDNLIVYAWFTFVVEHDS